VCVHISVTHPATNYRVQFVCVLHVLCMFVLHVSVTYMCVCVCVCVCMCVCVHYVHVHVCVNV